jgi:hypothetical protein
LNRWHSEWWDWKSVNFSKAQLPHISSRETLPYTFRKIIESSATHTKISYFLRQRTGAGTEIKKTCQNLLPGQTNRTNGEKKSWQIDLFQYLGKIPDLLLSLSLVSPCSTPDQAGARWVKQQPSRRQQQHEQKDSSGVGLTPPPLKIVAGQRECPSKSPWAGHSGQKPTDTFLNEKPNPSNGPN